MILYTTGCTSGRVCGVSMTVPPRLRKSWVSEPCALPSARSLLRGLPLCLLHLHLQDLDDRLCIVLLAFYRLLQLLEVALDERRLVAVMRDGLGFGLLVSACCDSLIGGRGRSGRSFSSGPLNTPF